MAEPQAGAGKNDCREEVPGELVVPGGDASEVLEFVEEALDEVALAVESGIDGPLGLSGALGGNVRAAARRGHQIEDGAGVVAAVGDKIAARREAVEQSRHRGAVVGLARSEDDAHREAMGVHHGIDLGAQSSTRTANGVIRAPFFPPAACWWARTIEESIR